MAQAVRSWAARVRIFCTSKNDESQGCSRIQGMRARWSKLATAALAEVTLS